MRRRSGTLDIYAWNNPEEYEAEYQCIASNEYGSAYSNKIRLRISSEFIIMIIIQGSVARLWDMSINIISDEYWMINYDDMISHKMINHDNNDNVID